jgi:hypothetical protein
MRIIPKPWVFSNRDLLDAVAAILQSIHVDRSYDIPLLAGYSLDGKTLYFDKDLPSGYAQRDGKFVTIEPFLVLHEAVESCLLHTYAKLRYQFAHEIALRAEEEAVRAAGIDPKQYNGFMEIWIKKARAKASYTCPPDLDMTPYKDSNEKTLIDKMVMKWHT